MPGKAAWNWSTRWAIGRAWRACRCFDRDFKAVGEEAFVPQTDTNKIGLFLLEERRFDDLRFSISARYETLEHDPSGDLARIRRGCGFLCAWALSGTGGQKLIPSLNLAYTERHPKAEELYSDGPAYRHRPVRGR